MSDWRMTTLGEAFSINPSRTIAKNKVTPFLPMDALNEFVREPARIDTRAFTGSGMKFQNGDTLLARITPCLENGKTAYVNGLNNGEIGHGSTEYVVISGIPEKSDNLFAYYIARSEEFRNYAIGHMEGTSGRQRVPASAVAKFPINLPPLATQRAIAQVLGALDDKIALNRRMNATLEAMARALFKDWFVDFGPVRAKMAGSAPTLDAALWDLFPSELGENGVPVGWVLSTVGEQIGVRGGTTPSTKEPSFWEGGNHSWATPKDLSRLTSPVLFETERQITDAGLREIGSGLLPAGALLMSSRAPIGYFALAQMPCAMNQGFIGMVCEGTLNSNFMLLWCKENMPAILSVSNGSTFLEVSRANFKPLPVVLASQNVLDAFYKQINPIFEQIVALTKESKTLATLRDTLLPKLLSGALSVESLLSS